MNEYKVAHVLSDVLFDHSWDGRTYSDDHETFEVMCECQWTATAASPVATWRMYSDHVAWEQTKALAQANEQWQREMREILEEGMPLTPSSWWGQTTPSYDGQTALPGPPQTPTP